MTTERKPINPVLKQVLDLGPTVFFVVLYFMVKDRSFTMGGTEYSGFIMATILFIPVLLASMAALWFLTGKLSRIQAFTAFMVIFFGALTAWFNDDRFFKMKTTIVYGLFAVLLGIGLLRGRSYLQWVMAEMMPMDSAGWMILTKRLCGFFAFMAVLNELTWRLLSNDAWVMIESFGFPLLMFAFLFWQFTSLAPYLHDDTNGDAKKG
ncbi:intracellular septation protein [Ketogulonicigenium robustum]|uniref:Inner membrane-spanning protein YciB n=1 Tax=Ketogulonicigenium robustum TaxID=92947 RepID=A0A1W6NY64_9RHOB|nr:inner membrane-spanning protein YciB [Ketogulonicigenium robustum]ARO14164.1 intracellular septation protein [Ketogulonicigenium robustum]